MSFQLTGIPYEPFASLFLLSDRELTERGARRVVALEKPGFPCRVSLVDAEIGEELLLLPFQHQPAASPYRASGPIFVRRAARPPALAAGEIPDYVATRQISVRAYDADHMMTDAAVCDGRAAGEAIKHMFHEPATAYIHLHNAKRGCYSCRVDRL